MMTHLLLSATILVVLPQLFVAAEPSSRLSSVNLSYQHHLSSDAITQLIHDAVRRGADDEGKVEVDISSTLFGDSGCQKLRDVFLIHKGGTKSENVVDIYLSARMDRISAVGASILFDAIIEVGRTKVSEGDSGEEDVNASSEADPNSQVDDFTCDLSISTTPEAAEVQYEQQSCSSFDFYVDTIDLGLNDLGHHRHNSVRPSASRNFVKSLRMLIEGSSTPSLSAKKSETETEHVVWDCPRVIRLDRCGLDPSACRAIGKGLLNAATSEFNKKRSAGTNQGRRRCLKCLYLSGNDLIGDSGAAALAAALRTAPRTGKNVGDERKALDPVLDVLDLSSCGIGDAGAEALALAFKDNPGCVKRLDLSQNHISDDGAVAIGKALSSSVMTRIPEKKGGRGDSKATTPQMDSIDLSGNKNVRDEGAKAIAKAMECGIVSSISMRSCSIRSDGATAFGKAVLAFGFSQKVERTEGSLIMANVDLSGNELGTLRPKKKNKPYSPSLLKSKASATTVSYMNFIGKKIKSGLKDAGLDVNFIPSGESDDEEEALMGIDEPEEGDSKSSTARCGARSFVEAFVNNNNGEAGNNLSQGSGFKCIIGMRQCALDQGAADALAAAVVKGRSQLGLDIAFDSSMNNDVEERAVSALQGDEDEQLCLHEMAKRYLDAVEALRVARQRAAEAAEAATARARAEQMMSDAFVDEEVSDFGAFPGTGYDDYDQNGHCDNDEYSY